MAKLPRCKQKVWGNLTFDQYFYCQLTEALSSVIDFRNEWDHLGQMQQWKAKEINDLAITIIDRINYCQPLSEERITPVIGGLSYSEYMIIQTTKGLVNNTSFNLSKESDIEKIVKLAIIITHSIIRG